MAGDELSIEVDADAVGVGFDGQSAGRVGGGDGGAIGSGGDAELAGGACVCRARDIVAVLVERLQMRTLLRKQIDGTLMCLAVNADVGDSVEPDLRGCLDGAEFGQLEPAQEVLLYVAHSRLDAALLVAAGDIAWRDGKAVVAGKKGITGVVNPSARAGRPDAWRTFFLAPNFFWMTPPSLRTSVLAAHAKQIVSLHLPPTPPP